MDKAIAFTEQDEEIFNAVLLTPYDDPERIDEIRADRQKRWDDYCAHFNGKPDKEPIDFFFPPYDAKPILNGKGSYGRIFIKRKDDNEMNELTRREELIMMLECIKDSIMPDDGTHCTVISGILPSSTEFVIRKTIEYLYGGDEE